MKLILTDRVIEPVQCPARRDHANFALRCVLDAEIEALEARLRQRSGNAAAACGLARADLDRQFGWLRDSVAKLQSRRDALCSIGATTSGRRPSVVDSVEGVDVGNDGPTHVFTTSNRKRGTCTSSASSTRP